MGQTLELTSAEQCSALAANDAVGRLPPAQFRKDGAEAHFVQVDDGGRMLARCSIWTRDTPTLDGRRLGAIGHYAAADAESGAAVLGASWRRLAEQGCALAVGPMDGNTWRRYRFVTRRGDEPPFMLEPDNPDDWPAHFTAAGFGVLARYVSTVNDNLSHRDPRLRRAETRMNDVSVRVRPIRPDDMATELARIHEVCLTAFRGALLYTPIGRDAFAALYEPIVRLVDPRLVLIAEHVGRPIGFIFAVADLNQARRGRPVDTIVIKTLAVVPDRLYAGLGTLLLDRCQQAAAAMGHRRAIHALMHVDNHRVQKLTNRFARPMREYALFAREIEP